MTTTIAKTEYLVTDVRETFPKAVREYLKVGYSEFDRDCQILLEWMDGEGGNVPSKACDEIWHGMILYTKKYFAWTKKHFGRVVHHIPNDEECMDQSGCVSCECGRRVKASCSDCSGCIQCKCEM